MKKTNDISESQFWQKMQDWTKENIDTPLVQNSIKQAQKEFPNHSKIQSTNTKSSALNNSGSGTNGIKPQ